MGGASCSKGQRKPQHLHSVIWPAGSTKNIGCQHVKKHEPGFREAEEHSDRWTLVAILSHLNLSETGPKVGDEAKVE